jgi:hypothetical protein
VVSFQFEFLVHLARPVGAFGDPSAKSRDVLFGETIALWGHGNLVIRIRDNLEEKALFGFSGNDGGKPGIPSFEHEGALVKPKARLLLFFSVALHTVILQDGGNVLLVGGLSLSSVAKKEACRDLQERGAKAVSEGERHTNHLRLSVIGCGDYATEILIFSGWDRISEWQQG